ncbi:MAG: hypothetical protein IJS32_01145 [Kiritimatiellae bacterium]|nr:hypothetical protein [Kiritimatiellia bacterium]
MPETPAAWWGEEEPPRGNRGGRLTFLAYAEKVLRRARKALTAEEIWAYPAGEAWRAMVRTEGTGQVKTLASRLYAAAADPASPFAGVGGAPVRFGLKKDEIARRKEAAVLLALANEAMGRVLHLAICGGKEGMRILKALKGRGVPVPFFCAGAWKVADRRTAEKALAARFGARRLGKDNAFYAVGVGEVSAFAREMGLESCLGEWVCRAAKESTAAEKRALARYRALTARSASPRTPVLPF